jgi:single-stranded-DNA-specific exonuclease
LRDCQFLEVSNANIRTAKGQKVEYIKTEFTLSDRQGNQIYGDWWGHYSYELPDTNCDVVIELVDNAFRRRYDARLIDFHAQSAPLSADVPTLASTSIQNSRNPQSSNLTNLQIIDWRGRDPMELERHPAATICDRCPQSWQDVNLIIDHAHQANQAIALVYPYPEKMSGEDTWQTLVGIAKYLSRTGKEIRRSQLIAKLGLEDQAILQLGFEALQQYGYVVHFVNDKLNDELNDPEPKIRISSISPTNHATIPKQFIQAVNELLFQQQFFDHQLISIIAPPATRTTQSLVNENRYI